MKKHLFLVALMTLMLFAGQAAAVEGLTFGAKAGLLMSNVNELPEDFEEADKSMKMGFAGGVFMNYAVNEMFSLQPELWFAMKGTKLEGGGEELTMKFNYLAIPVLAKYTFPTEGIFKPCIFAGPSLGINLTAKGDYKVSSEGSADLDFKDAANSIDFGIVGGVGFGVEAGAGMFTFDFRYELGLSKIITGGDLEISYPGGSDTEELPEADSKFYSLAFLVGYAF